MPNRPHGRHEPSTDGLRVRRDAVVAERGEEEGIARFVNLGGGADATLECVGTAAAVDQPF